MITKKSRRLNKLWFLMTAMNELCVFQLDEVIHVDVASQDI